MRDEGGGVPALSIVTVCVKLVQNERAIYDGNGYVRRCACLL